MGRPYSVYCGAVFVLGDGVFQLIHVDLECGGVNDVHECEEMLRNNM